MGLLVALAFAGQVPPAAPVETSRCEQLRIGFALCQETNTWRGDFGAIRLQHAIDAALKVEPSPGKELDPWSK